MTEHTWQDVDQYTAKLFFPPDELLEASLEAARAEGLPDIQVTAPQGRLLELLVRVSKARRVLEIGTLGGYSTTHLARGLPPGGNVISLELSPHHAEVARQNLARVGLAESVEVRVGPASESLAALDKEGAGPFDLIFIDADKVGYPDYFTRSLRLSAPGTLIVIDNVVRNGAVADATSTDANVLAVREMNELIAAARNVLATTLQIVGSKGWDGITLAYVTG